MSPVPGVAADILGGLSRDARRAAILQMERDNKKYPAALAEQPMPPESKDPRRVRVWRSREFIVQEFAEDGGIVRLSVNRCHVDPASLRWVDGITWDEFQRLKRECGYGDREAVEVYPPDRSVVNVGNLRHLWILPERLPFSWGRRG